MEKTGPVDNLEKRLHPDWWKKIFNAMYLKTDADVVQDIKITQDEVSLFVDYLQMDKEDVILDVSCGQGRHLMELGRRNFNNLYGLDRSRYLIQYAKKNAKKERLNINFKEGDARKLPYKADTFDYVTLLGNSFGYFENSNEDQKILKETLRVLKPGGKLLMDVADGTYLKDHFSARSWEWIDKRHFVCRERALAADNERLISREVITHIKKGVVADQFYAERLYSKEKLSGLLEKAGFEKTTDHSSLQTKSQRNQDLGMMENRFVISATVHKEAAPTEDKKKVKNIAVIMGDPKLHDAVKPAAIFDEDDFDAIKQLKDALGGIVEYNFRYLDNHASLIEDVQRLKGDVDFIFNLCDEGFGNEATKELHVPALLELVGIPYTGSKPQNLSSCYDKSLIRGIAMQIGVPVAQAFVIKPEQNRFEMNLPFPVITKPNYGDSSFGITKENVVNNIKKLDASIRKIRKQFGRRSPILVEEFLTGAEVTLGIIGNPPSDYKIFPIIEEDYSGLPEGLPKICGYEAKWLTDSLYFKTLKSVPANLSEETEQEIINGSLNMFERLECRDYARFDWRLNKAGRPKLLEVNPNPGWCWDGHLAKMAKLEGVDYRNMLQAILTAAEKRIEKEKGRS